MWERACGSGHDRDTDCLGIYFAVMPAPTMPPSKLLVGRHQLTQRAEQFAVRMRWFVA